ncbi:hypothetical protein, partial [Methylobacterium haplocladii]|uniref:hypothetical protein n=1 Tax=Methylobacterium haplocladii TaxID=1176176 RepID=UPI0024E0C13B
SANLTVRVFLTFEFLTCFPDTADRLSGPNLELALAVRKTVVFLTCRRCRCPGNIPKRAALLLEGDVQ